MKKLYSAIVVPRDIIDCNQLASLTTEYSIHGKGRTHGTYQVGKPSAIFFNTKACNVTAALSDGSMDYLMDTPTLTVNEVARQIQLN